jgi:DMSO/TMAO reductase YedYZ molybdopterin-dependent catalytic subunit
VKRRSFLLASLAVASPASADVSFADYSPEFEVDAQTANPRVRCFDLRRLTQHHVSADEFFLFHQTKTVAPVELKTWRLHISGHVQKPLTLSFADLVRRPAVQAEATVECSGNSGHSRLMNGLVSNAVWRGPALSPLLRECGVLPGAREVVFFGMDGETEKKWAAQEQEIHAPHGRSLFIQDAVDGDALLAVEMNGQALTPELGFPARLIVPGWYGMTQVKWLSRIVVLDRRYEGRHMARNYHSIRKPGAVPLHLETSITRMRLKSVVARVVRAESGYRIQGASWSGDEPVDKVQVRIDDGPWQDCELQRSAGRYGWTLWSASWQDATPGLHSVVSRAIDVRGRVQPDKDEWRRQFSSFREDNSQWTRKVLLS